MADNLTHPYRCKSSSCIISQRLLADPIRCTVGRVLTIDDLTDDVLLEIFHFYVDIYQDLDFHRFFTFRTTGKIESWQSLVHVCRRWRGLVFGSTRHLNLQICWYSHGRSARNSLDVWPALPLLILGSVSEASVDNVIAGLEHSDRICQIKLHFSLFSPNQKLWTAMEVPFPKLAALYLSGRSVVYGPVLPDSFLGGSAPRLRCFCLNALSFPGLPKLLLSTTNLVTLYLLEIPQFGYISPEVMATCLSTLTSLKSLQLEFRYGQSYPGLKSRRPFPPIRSVLPTLAIFRFKGVNEYLEEFVARIDAPQLHRLSITFIIDIGFNTPELDRFIIRTPILGVYDEARLIFHGRKALVRLRQSHPESDHRMVEVEISCLKPHRQFASLAQTCTSLLRLLLTLNLYIDGDPNSPFILSDDVKNADWLDLLLPFTAVKNLHLSQIFLPRIAFVLQELAGRRTTEVLPALQSILLEGSHPSNPLLKGIEKFISARQLTNQPIAISVWYREVWDKW